MPLRAQDIVTIACNTAKVPAWKAQGGQMLNLVLNELCTDYNLEVNRKTFNFSFNTGAGQNSGPYALPTDWLRADRNDVFYTILGVKYVMIPQSLAQFNAQVQQAGLNAYPENFAVDNSPISVGGAPNMYVWPPAGGSYPVTAVYFAQMPDIVTPETSSTIPWFPLQRFLIRRVTSDLMQMSGDDRSGGFAQEATDILLHYLKNEGNTQAVKTVTLDRRQFGLNANFNNKQNTKTIGW